MLWWPGVLREVTTHFVVDARSLGQPAGVKALISNPSGAATDAYVTDKEDGTFRVEYTPYEDGKTTPAPWRHTLYAGDTLYILYRYRIYSIYVCINVYFLNCMDTVYTPSFSLYVYVSLSLSLSLCMCMSLSHSLS